MDILDFLSRHSDELTGNKSKQEFKNEELNNRKTLPKIKTDKDTLIDLTENGEFIDWNDFTSNRVSSAPNTPISVDKYPLSDQIRMALEALHKILKTNPGLNLQ